MRTKSVRITRKKTDNIKKTGKNKSGETHIKILGVY